MASATPLPRWLYIPACLGIIFVLLPLVGILAKIPFGNFFSLLFTPSSVAALTVSLLTSTTATVICLFLGVPLACVLARADFPGRHIVRTCTLLPLVLPPVVGGIALLYTFGRLGLIGKGLSTLGIDIAFSTLAVILAQVFVAMPFIVMTLEGALRSHDTRYEVVATGLGASPGYVFRHITLPTVRPAIISGSILCFARTLGEFGATITFAGSLQGRTRTLPLEIYLLRETDPAAAIALSLVLIVLAALLVWVSRRV